MVATGTQRRARRDEDALRDGALPWRRPTLLPIAMRAFFDPADFAFVPMLEAAFPAILAELQALPANAFREAPDSLTIAADGYDERGWFDYPLFGAGDHESHRARC